MITPPRPRSTISGTKAWVRVTTASQLTRTISASRSRVELEEAAAEAEAGVVDQQVHVDAELLDLARELGRLGGEVAVDDVGRGRELLGELLEPVLAAGDQDQVVAAAGELAGELLADARGRAGDQCRLGHGSEPIPKPRESRTREPRRAGCEHRVDGALAPQTFEDRVRSWEAEYLWELGDALVSGAAARAGAGQPGEDAVPARPRPDRALEGVPAAQAQDAGVRGAGGGPLPDPAHPHARGLLHLADRRAGRWG